MTLEKEQKRKIIEELKAHEQDTGSAQVQIGLLTKEIGLLQKHLKDHPKDFNSQRGLLRMVAKRKKLLRYLQDEDEKAYQKVVKTLEL